MLFAIFLSLLIETKGLQEQCFQAMEEYLNYSLPTQFLIGNRQIEMSGNWPNRFGYYDQCLRENNHYSTLEVDATPIKFLYGFCHSSICDADDFNSPEGQKIIKKQMNNSLIKNISSVFHIDFSQSKLTFINPITYYPDFSWGTYCSIFLIIILIFISLIDPYRRFLDLLVGNQTTKPQGFIEDFSIIENYKKLINLKTIDPNLAIFNGIRTIAFFMVLYGHSTLVVIQQTFQTEIMSALAQWRTIIVLNMFYSVDIFFWLGGFFMAFVLCEKKRALDLKKKPLSILLVFLHRLLRIWPCYILCIMINSYIVPFSGEGPRWWQAINYTFCEAGSWRNILFIDNFFHDWKLCFGWGWYLTSDIQLFMICLFPIMIYALGYKKLSKILINFMLLLSIIYGLIICFEYKFLITAKNTTNQNFYYQYYINSLARSPPYIFGLLIGLMYRELKQNEQNNILYILKIKAEGKKFRIIFSISCYISGICIISWLFFGWRQAYLSPDPQYWSFKFQHIYQALSRLLFVFGITLLCLPNMIGIYDIFNRKLMNNLLFKFIAKISFACYLIHYMILLIVNFTFYGTPTFITIEVFQLFVGCLAITIICSIFLTLIVEMPFGTLQVKLIDSIMQQKQKEILVLQESKEQQ